MTLALCRQDKHHLPSRSGSVVGRSTSAEITLGHRSVSRNHCVIRRSHGCLLLRDLGSRNGTFLNGQRLRRQKWAQARSGDVVRLGDVELRVEDYCREREFPDLSHATNGDELTTSAIWRPQLLPNLAPMCRPDDESDLSLNFDPPTLL